MSLIFLSVYQDSSQNCDQKKEKKEKKEKRVMDELVVRSMQYLVDKCLANITVH